MMIIYVEKETKMKRSCQENTIKNRAELQEDILGAEYAAA
jgi:hypothetical protein